MLVALVTNIRYEYSLRFWEQNVFLILNVISKMAMANILNKYHHDYKLFINIFTIRNLRNLQKYGFSARPLLHKPGVGGEGLEG